MRARIRDDVQSGAEKQQREYFLRKQMESIRKELGEDEGSVVDEYRRKIEEAGMPDAVREQAEKELVAPGADGRCLRRVLDDPDLPRLADRRAVGRSARRSGSIPVHAREVLDADHAGLEDVKDRITEYIAVRKLRADRGIAEEGGPRARS